MYTQYVFKNRSSLHHEEFDHCTINSLVVLRCSSKYLRYIIFLYYNAYDSITLRQHEESWSACKHH